MGLEIMKKFCEGRSVGKSLGIYKIIIDALDYGEEFLYIASEDIEKTLKAINDFSEKEIVSEIMNKTRGVYKLKYK